MAARDSVSTHRRISLENPLTHRMVRTSDLSALPLSVFTLAVGLVLSGCSTSEPEPEPTSGLPEDYVSVQWIEREVRLHTLDRMIDEAGSDEVLVNAGGTREHLFDHGVIVSEDGDEAAVDWEAGYEDGGLAGFVVELNKEAWEEDSPLFQIDNALGNAMRHNEVTWCEETVSGEVFVKAYRERLEDAFDSQEEYTASITDYVDCGTGEP